MPRGGKDSFQKQMTFCLKMLYVYACVSGNAFIYYLKNFTVVCMRASRNFLTSAGELRSLLSNKSILFHLLSSFHSCLQCLRVCLTVQFVIQIPKKLIK